PPHPPFPSTTLFRSKRWIAEGRYKPKPRFHVGALVEAVGPAADGQPVGQMFPQPRVDTRTEQNVLLDDVLGPWFSVLVWGNDPRDRKSTRLNSSHSQ